MTTLPRDEKVFVDTSIQIALFVHSPETKASIRGTLANYRWKITGRVVRAEFIRRLLREADYLLRLLSDKGSYSKVLRHVVDVLPPQQQRKRNIALEVLTTVGESESDEDLTERLRLYLKRLLRSGGQLFDQNVDELIDSGCALGGKLPVPKGQTFVFEDNRCSRQDSCKVSQFLDAHVDERKALLGHLTKVDPAGLSIELGNAITFLTSIQDSGCTTAPNQEPCLKVGDTIIALESAGAGTMFTMNKKESEVLVCGLSQKLAYRSPNPSQPTSISSGSDSREEAGQQ